MDRRSLEFLLPLKWLLKNSFRRVAVMMMSPLSLSTRVMRSWLPSKGALPEG
jgi:hypothetical protein